MSTPPSSERVHRRESPSLGDSLSTQGTPSTQATPRDLVEAASLKPKPSFVTKNFLILGLVTVIPLALVNPGPGAHLKDQKPFGVSTTNLAIVVIFLISGLSLKAIETWNGLYAAASLGFVLILFVTPLIIVPLQLLSVLGFSSLLVKGLCIFCAVPTTLSSGVVLVEAAGGNVQLALILTTLTNSLGVITMPFMVSYIFRQSAQIDRLAMFHELVVFVVVPLVCGVVLRSLSQPIREAVNTHKPSFTMANNSLILFTVWMTVSEAQPQVLKRTPFELIALVVVAFLVHLIFLAISYAVTRGFEPTIKRALIVMASQKSLPKCIMLISALPPVIQTDGGVLLLPCVVGHAVQLLFDAWLVSTWEPLPETSKLLPK